MAASRPLGLFDQEIRQRKLEALGDPLVALNAIVPGAIFRKTLDSMRNEGRDPRKGAPAPHDAVRMLKVLVLRELYALSDEQVEYQIAEAQDPQAGGAQGRRADAVAPAGGTRPTEVPRGP